MYPPLQPPSPPCFAADPVGRRSGIASSRGCWPPPAGAAAEGEAARLPRCSDVTGVEPRVVGADGSHPDGEGIRRGADLVDEATALFARDPAFARDGHVAVKGHCRLVGDEWTALGYPRPPALVLGACSEA